MSEFSFRVFTNGDLFDIFYNGLYMETFYLVQEDGGRMGFSSLNGLTIEQVNRDRFRYVAPCGSILEGDYIFGLQHWILQTTMTEYNMSFPQMIFTNCAEVIND